MPFEFTGGMRIAIIGSGISGLAAAYELADHASVKVFEAADRLGGHARTVMAGPERNIPVDTGFIVFNHPNYPNLSRLFRELDVPTKRSSMSFGASFGGGQIEYGIRDFAALTAQRRNLVRPRYWRMMSDILKFNRVALEHSNDSSLTLGALLDKLEMGEWFRRYYLLPFSGAIWSSTPEQMEAFPAKNLVRFFHNHSLLGLTNHQWHTVDGGSIEYVKRIAAAIENRGGVLLKNAAVVGVRRNVDGVEVRTHGGEWERFDEVIFACHSDDALALIDQPTADEQRILSRLRYQTNKTVLHGDPRQMPKRKNCWASWVFISDDVRPTASIAMTYWMNSLQGIDPKYPMFLSLNPSSEIDDRLIYDEAEFRHPVFDHAATEAQTGLPGLQGQNHSWFCGAYAGFGFHEDGYASALDVVHRMRAKAMI